MSPPGEARAYWREWRKSVDAGSLDAVSLFLLPLLRERLEGWLAGDPAGPLLLGVCKQAWSANQLRLRNLQVLWKALAARGVRGVVIGAAASALRAEGAAIPPLSSFEIMVPLDGVAPALEEARRLGWHPRTALPESAGEILKSRPWVPISNGGGAEWNLRWRRFSSAPDLACEAAAILAEGCAGAAWMGTTFTIPPPAWHLLETLADEPYRERPFWFGEAVIALRQPIDWQEFRRLLEGCASPGGVLAKLRYLACIGHTQIPHRLLDRPRGSWRLQRRIRSVYRDYRLWRSQAGQEEPPRKLGRYLRIRWGARCAAELPLLALRALAMHFRQAADQ
jgi:hypothetical protein